MVYFYRDVLDQDSPKAQLWNEITSKQSQNVVFVGGGGTACELSQSIARLGKSMNWNVSIIAPYVLHDEDISIQHSAMKLLVNDGITIHFGRALNIFNNTIILDTNAKIPVDTIIFTQGRSPSLSSLNLSNANVKYNQNGILINPYLQSTNKNIYACGDCASIPKSSRRAIHAGWMGFHSVKNAFMPFFLRSPAVHNTVPRVYYTYPELASVGLTHRQCVLRKYPIDTLCVYERGTDRADMESRERFTNADFVQLHVDKFSGGILGGSICSPSASDICNELSTCIVNRLSVRDVARSLHSYPSHGYLLYRLVTLFSFILFLMFVFDL